MKLIVLQAFGGKLVSDPIEVPEYPLVYRLLHVKQKPVNLAKDPISDEVTYRYAIFKCANRFIDLPNKNSALVYELESI